MTQLLNIAIKAGKRKPMQLLDAAEITRQLGVANDFRGKPSKRQVTVLDLRSWKQACEKLGKNLPWETRRANLLVDDLKLFNTAGQIILIGDVALEITQETDPCSRMDEAELGLFDALKENWWGGVCCRVIADGKVNIGDSVLLMSREKYEHR